MIETPLFIINTHGHADHIGCNFAFHLPIYIHEGDASFLSDPYLNLSSLFGQECVSPPAAKLLKHGDAIAFGKKSIDVIHTPGHTPGSICLKIDSCLFSGDTLFQGSIGRTDFPYSDSRLIVASIKEQLMHFFDSCRVYPGHGPESVLGWEKQHNFYLSSEMQ